MTVKRCDSPEINGLNSESMSLSTSDSCIVAFSPASSRLHVSDSFSTGKLSSCGGLTNADRVFNRFLILAEGQRQRSDRNRRNDPSRDPSVIAIF